MLERKLQPHCLAQQSKVRVDKEIFSNVSCAKQCLSKVLIKIDFSYTVPGYC